MELQGFPKQMVSDKVKATKKWQEDCVDAAISSTFNSGAGNKELDEMNINYGLYNNKLDMNDMLLSIGKDGILGKSFSDNVENHPIMSPKIALLVGESVKRRFDWNVAVSTPNVIAEKDRKLNKEVNNRLLKLANPEETPDMSPADIEAEIKKLSRWKKYGFRDIREMTITNLLNYYYEEQSMPTKFAEGITSAILTNREFYDISIYDNKLSVTAIDPRTLRYIISSGSRDIEDSDVIVHSTYQTVGSIIDKYYDTLTEKQIAELESGVYEPSRKDTGGFKYTPTKLNYAYELTDFNDALDQAGVINNNGEYRVDHVLWKSRRKVGKVEFTNDDDEQDVKLVPDGYKINKDLGEKVKWFWINEWWESTKVLDIYINTRPKQIQFRGVDNISLSRPGIVGTIYPGASIASKAKPYQYLYNIIAYKLRKVIAKYKGPMIELDLAKVPEGWDMAKWLKVGDETGYLPIDSFKEGNKGASTGKLAGSIGQTSGKEYSQHAGGYFNDMFNMMNYLSEEMGDIIGVSKQREGTIGTREAKGSVDRAITGSANVTEELFHYHEYTKLKVFREIVENAKFLYKNDKSKVIQYLVDESSIASFNVDGELINESDYAVMLSNSQNITELINNFKQLAPEGLRAGKFNYSNIMDVYLSKSLAETRRTIEGFELQADEAARKQAEAESKAAQEEAQRQAQVKQAEQEFEKYKVDEENRVKIQIQEMKDAVDREKIAVDREKIDAEDDGFNILGDNSY